MRRVPALLACVTAIAVGCATDRQATVREARANVSDVVSISTELSTSTFGPDVAIGAVEWSEEDCISGIDGSASGEVRIAARFEIQVPATPSDEALSGALKIVVGTGASDASASSATGKATGSAADFKVIAAVDGWQPDMSTDVSVVTFSILSDCATP